MLVYIRPDVANRKRAVDICKGDYFWWSSALCVPKAATDDAVSAFRNNGLEMQQRRISYLRTFAEPSSPPYNPYNLSSNCKYK